MTITIVAKAPPAATTFRDALADDSPTWLNGFWGSRYMYAMGVVHDAMFDWFVYSVRARYPSVAPDDAFVWFSQDRLIDRGFQEPLESYRARLKLWLDLWRHAGSAWGVALAFSSYLTPSTAKIRVVSNNANWDTLDAGSSGPPTHQHGDGSGNPNWDWDSYPWLDPSASEYTAKWYRAWIIIYPGTDLWTKTRTLGTGAGGNMLLGDGSCLGFSGTIDQTESMRALARRWKGGHNKVMVILAFDSRIFDPAYSVAYPSAILPFGLFRSWGVRASDLYVPIRSYIGTGLTFGTNAASYIDVPDEPETLH